MAFAIAAFIIIVIPGPSVLFIVARALSQGRSVALLTVAGNTIGEYAQVVAVAFGIGVVAERSVALFSGLKLFGAAYLVYLGVKTIRSRGDLESALRPGLGAQSRRRSFTQGFLVGISNPKTVIFLAAILPEFVSRTGGEVPEQILILGLIFSAIALLCDSTWGLLAGAARSWFARSPRRLRLIGGIGGLAIIGIGLRLAASGRAD